MNAKMLMLGILLLAGLSFALTANWMTYSVDRYGCNYYYNDDGWEDIGLYTIAEEHDETCDEGCWDFEDMGESLDDMAWEIWDDGGDYGMCYYSGCWGSESISATNFRPSMLAYHVAAAGYRAEFLAGLRAYLAEGGGRADIFEDMGDARDDYFDCLEYVLDEGPCYMCE